MSKLSKKDLAAAAAAAKQNEPVVQKAPPKPKKVHHKVLGMSFSTTDRGFNMAPEGFQVCESVFDLLFERFDEEMMKKRVEREYLKYSVQNAIMTTQHAINLSNITNDKGDIFEEYPIHDFEPYNYAEESTEPIPPPLDSHGKQGKMADKDSLTCRFNVEQFNKLFNRQLTLKMKPTGLSPQKNVRFRKSNIGPQETLKTLLTVDSALSRDKKGPRSRRSSAMSSRLELSP